MQRRNATKLIPSIAIFISGYTPLFLIMMIKDITSINWYTHQFDTVTLGLDKIDFPVGLFVKNPSVVWGLLMVSAISLLLLWYVLKNITSNPFEITITSAKSRSSEVVNYTIPYMISFVAFDLSKWQDLLALIIFLGILCLLSIRSQSIFINPILAALGYGLYDCSYTENAKTKECVMLSPKDLTTNDSVKYKKLNNYMGIINK
jgi:hypothetical protein